ncbi:hypothetical protein RND81_06G171100 [Saponaria officinalis]|uniref:Uncharacterized protein n=1 Tax=Saponaria officinalis TaxID=3572 RepID=A0AAW1KB14_SAPOF
MKGLLSDWGLSARRCDSCHTAAALLYCRADSAFLCGACDVKIHAANCHGVMTVRHERVWMCEVCEHAPAAVTCKADAAMLCSSCDHDIHSANPLARRHERVPVVPFIDSAVDAAFRSSSTTATSTFLNPNHHHHHASDPTAAAVPAPVKFSDEDDAEAWLIPNPNSSFMYAESNLLDFSYGGQNLEKHSEEKIQQKCENQSFAFTDCVVPTQSNGNLSFSNAPDHVFEVAFDIDFSQPAKHQNKKNKLNNSNQQLQLFSSFNFSAQNSVSSSDIGVVPDGNANSTAEVSYNFCSSVTSSAAVDGGSTAVPALDRAARVLRYREKRKNRKFEKTIRYASRKAYAETRPRVKGRFVKRTGNNETSEIGQMFAINSSGDDSGFDFVLDQGYGVVPTF